MHNDAVAPREHLAHEANAKFLQDHVGLESNESGRTAVSRQSEHVSAAVFDHSGNIVFEGTASHDGRANHSSMPVAPFELTPSQRRSKLDEIKAQSELTTSEHVLAWAEGVAAPAVFAAFYPPATLFTGLGIATTMGAISSYAFAEAEKSMRLTKENSALKQTFKFSNTELDDTAAICKRDLLTSNALAHAGAMTLFGVSAGALSFGVYGAAAFGAAALGESYLYADNSRRAKVYSCENERLKELVLDAK